jgi:hypothetical protein
MTLSLGKVTEVLAVLIFLLQGVLSIIYSKVHFIGDAYHQALDSIIPRHITPHPPLPKPGSLCLPTPQTPTIEESQHHYP